MLIDATTHSSYATGGIFDLGYTLPGFMERGACRGMSPRIFYPERGDDTTYAISVCRSCPVKDECLKHALDEKELFGIWGGKTSTQRRRLLAETGVKLSYKPPVPAPTSCFRGHPFNEVNTYTAPNGSRKCRICHRMREVERNAKKRKAIDGAN